MSAQLAKLLLQKYISGNCTENEKAQLESWFLQQDIDAKIDLSEADHLVDLIEVRNRLELDSKNKKRHILWPRLAAAATITLAFGFGMYFYFAKDSKTAAKVQTEVAADIKPGGNKALLILADGKTVDLNDVKDGEVAEQSGIKITKSADGQLVYNIVSSNPKNNSSNSFNTIETPRGGQYQVRLPDGTKVWLNAASSLKFPTSFAGNVREVRLSGEAYFEVAKDKTKPFKVISDKQTVEVLGTHFNISDYADETATKTTLLEGSVKVEDNTKRQILLKPGQQAILSKSTFEEQTVDVEEAVAWKNGQFVFSNERLETIMQRLGRWYDVDIEYGKGVSNLTFTGAVSKYKDVSEVLATLELTNSVHFKISNHTILVTK